MFDEFEEVKYFKEITISRALWCRIVNEIKRLKSLQVKPEAYLEPKRASTMGLFCEYT